MARMKITGKPTVADAKAAAEKRKASPRRDGVQLTAEEMRTCIHTLALTDNTREAARKTGCSRSTAWKIYQQHQDQVLMCRVEIDKGLDKEFLADIVVVLHEIREVVSRMVDAESSRLLAPTVLVLSEAAALLTERRQVLVGQPSDIVRREGALTGDVGASLQARVERDRAYLRTLGVPIPGDEDGPEK